MPEPSPLATPMPWNLVSAAYDEEVVPQFTPYAERALELAAVRDGTRVLDVACGPGTLTLLAARRGATVDALDFSEWMIGRLRASLAREGIDRTWASLQRTFAPLVLLIRKMGPAWPPLGKRIHRDLAADHGEGVQSITMPAWLGVGRR